MQHVTDFLQSGKRVRKTAGWPEVKPARALVLAHDVADDGAGDGAGDGADDSADDVAHDNAADTVTLVDKVMDGAARSTAKRLGAFDLDRYQTELTCEHKVTIRNIAAAIRARVTPVARVDLDLPARQPMREPPNLGRKQR
ncbi:MAG: hypothetical protein ACKOBM_06855 [Gammaproteobacteria bacterium]